MILFLEPTCWNSRHVPFNAGMLEVACSAYPGDDVRFLGERGHLQAAAAQLPPAVRTRITWRAVEIPGHDASYIGRLITELRLAKGVLRELRNGSCHFVSLSALPSTILALKLAVRAESYVRPIHVVLHDNAETGLVGRRYRRPIRRLQDMKTAVCLLGNESIRYLVLEESIRAALVEGTPGLSKNLAVLEHPLPPGEGPKKAADLKPPIRIGFLGLATEQKGFAVFTRAAAVAKSQRGIDVQFHAIGRIPAGAVNGSMSMLETCPASGSRSREEYIDKLQQLHFAVFPYSRKYYALCPSGTLMDAIAWEIPLIASRIPIFESLFSRFGDLGYLFSDEAELGSIILQLSEHPDPLRYIDQRNSIRRVRHSRVPLVLAVRLRELVENPSLSPAAVTEAISGCRKTEMARGRT